MATWARIVRPLDRREIDGYHRYRRRIIEQYETGSVAQRIQLARWSCQAPRCDLVPDWETAICYLVRGTEQIRRGLWCQDHARAFAHRHGLRFGRMEDRQLEAARGVEASS